MENVARQLHCSSKLSFCSLRGNSWASILARRCREVDRRGSIEGFLKARIYGAAYVWEWAAAWYLSFLSVCTEIQCSTASIFAFHDFHRRENKRGYSALLLFSIRITRMHCSIAQDLLSLRGYIFPTGRSSWGKRVQIVMIWQQFAG